MHDNIFIALDRLPEKPFCSTDPKQHGLWTRVRSRALTHEYIQLDPPGTRLWMAFDVDRPAGALAWQPEGLPPPAWACTTPESRHGHIVYGLSVPVVGRDLAEHQVRYYEAVYEAYRARLGADEGYARVVTKNPLHPKWIVERGIAKLWTLGELAEYVKLPRLKLWPGQEPTGGLGRNCDTFDRLRHWAYRRVAGARGTGTLEQWRAACDEKVQELDRLNRAPLGWKETQHISKSVATWTWRNYDGSAGSEGKNRIAQELGKLGGRPGHGEPWIALGISRAHWFRLRQLPASQMQSRFAELAEMKRLADQLKESAFHSRTFHTTEQEVSDLCAK